MGYNWIGMRKICWREVMEIMERGDLAGYFKLYDDGTESIIEDGYSDEEIISHHNNGGEFGEEIKREKITEICTYCENGVEIDNIGIQLCPA